MTPLAHKTLEAVTTTQDQGAFSALAATYAVDRVNDRIKPGAFEKTISQWNGSGRNVPLHWDHQGSADSIIGYVNPSSMRETEQGLYVEGQIDLKGSRMAREAWRSMKNNAVALSFGYLATNQKKGKDGVNDLLELDLFEISVVPAPANPDTRFLSLKGLEDAKAVWSTAFINDLPDSAFLYVEDGEKDSDGKTTPRTKRHFPYKNAEGQVDLPHLRNALARIPQSSLSQDLKDRLTAKAQRILDNANKALSGVEDEQDEARESKSRPSDPLRKQTFDLAMALATDGIERQEKPAPEPQPEPLDAAELRRRTERAALDIALG